MSDNLLTMSNLILISFMTSSLDILISFSGIGYGYLESRIEDMHQKMPFMTVQSSTLFEIKKLNSPNVPKQQNGKINCNILYYDIQWKFSAAVSWTLDTSYEHINMAASQNHMEWMLPLKLFPLPLETRCSYHCCHLPSLRQMSAVLEGRCLVDKPAPLSSMVKKSLSLSNSLVVGRRRSIL